VLLTYFFFGFISLPRILGYHEYSFAYATMGKRLPTILGKAIEDVVRTLNEQVRAPFFSHMRLNGLYLALLKQVPTFFMYQIHQYDEGMIVDLTECIKRMDILMADLTSNQKLRPIIDDNEGDVALWNKVNLFLSSQLCRSFRSGANDFCSCFPFRFAAQEIAKFFRGKGLSLQVSQPVSVTS